MRSVVDRNVVMQRIPVQRKTAPNMSRLILFTSLFMAM